MNHAIKLLAVLAFLAGVFPLVAEPTPVAAAPKKDAPFKLSPFVVSDSVSSAGRYLSFESTSAGRVRMDLMDSSLNVSVITSEVLQDVAGSRILDATKYVAGISESNLPTSWERINIRGFQGEGRTVDGFTFSSYMDYGLMNMDPAIIERIEVIKGPSSVLAPQPTSPGGTINNATKKPQFRDFGLINLQWGRVDANSGFLDVNRIVNDRLAVRFVGSVRDWDNWWKSSSVRSTTLMPGFTYRFSASAQVTVQYIYTDWKAANYFGLPIDPTSGTTTQSKLLVGVPRDLDVFADDVYRADRQNDFKLLFTADLGRGVSMRLSAIYHTVSFDGPQMNTGPSTGGNGGNYDPLTGFWNYGLQYAQTPPYASSPIAAQPSRTFVRGGVQLLGEPREWQVQNDYAYILESGSVKSTTLAGFAYLDLHDNHSTAYNIFAPPFNIDHYVDTRWTRGPLNYSQLLSNRFLQGYLSETLALFQNRVILNAAESWQSYDQGVRNLMTGAVASNAPNTALPSYGIVLKPLKEAVSLYYSYTEQSSANPPSASGFVIPPLSNAQQKEFGARIKVWHDKLYFTVSHFDIFQTNFSITNPGNLRYPPPNPLLPPLLTDRTAKGWEYELRANPSKNLSIVGGYTRFKNRDENGVEIRGVAEKAGSLLASYAFAREQIPALDGFRIAVGVEYLSKRPSDTIGGFTAASTPANPIPIQPSFYLSSRTLLNLTLAYDSRHHWGAQVNVDNLLNEEYFLSAANRSALFTGPPRNFKISFRRSF